MAVTNPRHLSEGRRVRIYRNDGNSTSGTLLNNDNKRETLCLEISEGFFEQIGYAEIDRATVSIREQRREIAL